MSRLIAGLVAAACPQVAILGIDDPSIAAQLPGGVYPADMNYLQAWVRARRLCHADGPGLVPDLFSLTPEKHARFKSVVYDGALKSRGMASFSDVLTEADVDAIHAYIVDETRKRTDASTQR